MCAKYSRTPHNLSVIERMQQERAGLEPGTRCAVHMIKGIAVIKGGRRVGTRRDKGASIGQCPRYATISKDGVPLCDAHK